ncbi:MAG: hypothetical protein WDN26_07265 [Chitinophagaceae bacterium]
MQLSCAGIQNIFIQSTANATGSSNKTITGIPNFPAYIQATLLSVVLHPGYWDTIIPGRKTEFDAMAQEAIHVKNVRRHHYRADCEVGLQTGKELVIMLFNGH